MKRGEIVAKIFRFRKHAKKRMFKVSDAIKAAVSLIIVVTLTVTATYAWFSTKESPLTTNNFSLKCGKQLRVNDSGTSNLSFSQFDQFLVPCSSVDGRNIFFPTDGSDFSNSTTSMTFRSGNAGDKNKNYIQIDFTLTAQADHTALYINTDETKIEVCDSNSPHNESDYSVQRAAPLRAAIWCENNEDNVPVVLNPLPKKIVTPAVSEVDRATGTNVYTSAQTAQQFEYYSASGGHSVATLKAGQETHFSYIIWLEGADSQCTYEKISAKDIRASIAFTTSWDHVEKIRLRDKSDYHWIKTMMDNHYNLSLRHTYGDKYNDYTMTTYYNADYEWYCSLPHDITHDISFILRPTSASTGNNLKTYVFEKNESGAPTLERHHNRLYEVTNDANNTASDCRGHWVPLGDSEGGGSHSGDIDGDDF
jgi:hypothetical protein